MTRTIHNRFVEIAADLSPTLTDAIAEVDSWLSDHDTRAQDVIGRAADQIKRFQELPSRPGFWRDFVPPETLADTD